MSEASRVMLVGELNPYGADPRYALYDEPSTSAGGRMRRLVCGLPRPDYLSLRRANLCVGKWSLPAARRAADILVTRGDLAVFVLLGRKVAGAFGVEWPPFQHGLGGRVPRLYVTLPHPSGLCRMWNEPGAFERAREVLRKAAPDVSWGSLS